MSEHQINNPELHSDTNEREQAVIREARFFEPYKDELRSLFKALNREDEWAEDPSGLLSYVRRAWIGREHGNATSKDQFTDDEIAAAMPILESMGFSSEVLPGPDETFDQTIVVAGYTTANYRRLHLTRDAREQGTELGTEIWLVGQRPREDKDGTADELLKPEGKFSGYDYSRNPWAEKAKELIENSEDSDKKWNFTETETARIALMKVIDPEIVAHRMNLNLIAVNGQPVSDNTSAENAPTRDITDYYYETQDGHEIILLNGKAVERRNGDEIIEPRHTTRSVTQEWLMRHAPKKNARVLYVTGNPHSLRTTQDTHQVLTEMGREDIELVVAGTSPAAGLPIQSYLGEVARLIDNDYKRNYADKQ